MTRVWLVARRELLEHRRQPAMILAMALVLASICGTVLFGAGTMALIASDPAQIVLMKENLEFAGFALEDPVGWSVDLILSSFNFLLFTQFLGMTAVMAGHAVVHERQCGTLPFLLLAPVRRSEVVLGKILGAVGTPWLLTLAIGGTTAALLSLLDVTAAHAWRLPPSPGWLVAFFLGGPLWAMALAGAGAAISTRSRDVRTAQQGVWLVVYFATLFVGLMLGGGLQEDLGFQVAAAVLGAMCTALTVGLGVLLFRRDIH